MSLLERTKFLLRSYRSLPKKAFGQNFMVEPSIHQLMVSYASLNRNDTVLDIGAGLGFLSRFMADKCKTVLAIEADAQVARILFDQFADTPNVKVVEGDVFKVDIPSFNKIVSTPPYNISSRLLLWILGQSFDCSVLVFQKEFASRLVASIGNHDYGWLAVLTYYYAEVELLSPVPRSMFYPRPKVDSIITRLIPKRPHALKLEDEATFRRLVRSLFTQRNKKIRNAVLPYLRTMRGMSKDDAARTAEKLPCCDKRVRELAPEDFGALANALTE